jgi:mRNA interferase MazF
MSRLARGQIWWTDLGDATGSAPAFRHPVLVIQRDEVNESRLNTVVVCVLTSNTALARAPGNTLLPRRQTGLKKDSVANASQIVTLDRGELETLVGVVPSRLMDRVDAGLRWFLRLDPG